MPIHMRMRKLRGPHMKKSMPFEPFRTHTQAVNLRRPRGPLRLRRRGDARRAARKATSASARTCPVKMLAKGEITKPLTVHAHAFSGIGPRGDRGRRRHLRRRRAVAGPCAAWSPRSSARSPSRRSARSCCSRRRCSPSTASARTSRSPASTSNAVQDIQEQFGGGGILNLLNTFSGGGLSRIAVFALGHHALHHGVDHPAAADGRRAVAGEALRRRARSARRGSRSTRAT